MKSPFVASVLSISLLATTAGCAHGRQFKERSARKTCVVLSMGDVHGLAHIGALRAVKDAGLDVDCVTGSSMGALIGGLYASAPEQDPGQRFSEFMAKYVDETKATAANVGLIGALLLGGLAIATGGGALLVAGAAVAGGAGGAMAVDKVELERTAAVYDSYVNGVEVEDLPLEFATWFKEVKGTGVRTVAVTDGKLALGVKKSIANPVVFDEINPARSGYVDPGIDSILAIPVRDTCRLHPRSQILAINVTNQEVEIAGAKCPVLEVRVDVPVNKSQRVAALRGSGPEFDRIVQAGYEATCSVLRSCKGKRGE